MAPHETMREVSCVNWHSSIDNYWKWDQEVPQHCYRKCHDAFFSRRKITIFKLSTVRRASCRTLTRTGLMYIALDGAMNWHTKLKSGEFLWKFTDIHPWIFCVHWHFISCVDHFLLTCIHHSHQCKTFGQAFQREDDSFYSTFTVTCQWDKRWTASIIPHPCKCEKTKNSSLW